MTTIQIVSLLAVLALAAAHLFAAKLRFLGGTPRSVWLSAFGGVSVAYVFVHLLPELAEGQETLREAVRGGLGFLENHIYLIALLGLAVFYGVERTTAEGRKKRRGAPEMAYNSPGSGLAGSAASAADVFEGGEESTAGGRAFWLSMGSFAVYNFLIGYLLLHRFGAVLAAGGAEGGEGRAGDLGGLIVFALAMLLHFVVNDYGLREKHRDDYRRIGRWMLAATVLLGWVVGLAANIPEVLIAVLTAFLAGGIILNVLKEELPEERRSRFWPFAVGAALYTALLLAL